MTDTLIILAGGASSRMKKSQDHSLSEEESKQANTRSKALILINNRPMMDYVIYSARQASIKKIIIVISPQGKLFKEYYGLEDSNNDFHGVAISYAIQYIPEGRLKPLGTADAVLQTLEQHPHIKGKTFLVCNSDNLYSTKVIKKLRKSTFANVFIAYDRDALNYPIDRISRFALAQIDKDGFLTDIIEKPEPQEMERFKDEDGRFRVSMNIFKFDGKIFYPYLKNCSIHPQRNEKELPTALLAMIANNPEAVKAIPMAEHVPDLTGKNDIKVMNAYLSRHIPNLNWN